MTERGEENESNMLTINLCPALTQNVFNDLARSYIFCITSRGQVDYKLFCSTVNIQEFERALCHNMAQGYSSECTLIGGWW